MDLNDLKKYACPQLTVIPQNFHGEQLEEMRWMRGLHSDMAEFRVNFSDAHLEKNEIIVPIFVDDVLLPITYTTTPKNESKASPKSYNPFSNYVFYEVEYRRAHLTKITHHFGIRVFNDNDEKYLKPIILEKIEYRFEYDFKLQRWKWMQYDENIKKWEAEKEKIDLLFEADEVIEVTKKYFASRNLFQTQPLNSFTTYNDLLKTFVDLLKNTMQFIELRTDFGDIHELAFQKMTRLLNESSTVLEYIEVDVKNEKLTNYQPTATDLVEYQINNRISNLYVSLKTKIFEPGYWVIDQHVDPNIGEHYNLSQKANTNRTVDTKYQLQHELIKKADGRNPFILLSSIDMKKTGD